MILIIFLIFLILISAFLSGSETALFSLSPMTLKFYQKSESHRRHIIASLMLHPRNVLVTLLMINILVNILIQNTVANLFEEGGWGLKVGLPLFLTLVFGEILPKSIALPKNTEVAAKVAPIIQKLSQVLSFIRKPLTELTDWLSRLLLFFMKKEETISREELKHVLQESEENGVLLAQECDLISGIFDMGKAFVKEKMRPRDEVIFYSIEEDLSELENLFIEQKVTRVPVCEGDLEKVVGIVSVREFFLHREKMQSSKDLVSIIAKPFFVPENTTLLSCLKNMRDKGLDLSMVVDEYGSVSGLITQKDIIETVIGKTHDHREVMNLYTRSGTDVIIASGKLELTEFKTIFGIPLKTKENIVTLAGWLIEQMEDIPKVGMKYVTEDFLFYILAAEPNRVKRVYVRHLKSFSLKKGLRQ